MVQAEIQQTQSEYLKPAFLKEKQLEEVIILDEFRLVETEFIDKKTNLPTKKASYTGKVQCQVDGNPIKTWSMNKTSANTVIKVLGTETKNWIGKKISILVSSIANNESIIVNEIGTRKLNPTN